ncbi:hypothetical protein BDF21DRAFT_450556 [Thamnidium elegans]|uniref:ASX DEUBAD domain-containing protein n=1 Tax=Thamnidium elegans TaxID=101142 RepID=A0A8H7SQS9_9FUNG|nr:hypothetical protein INT48_009269 [Thamnidium elegans]KAI8087437.1 hypothetical protein BDF21DRAFT_450556 [Thamnidium elegans]
MYRRSSSPENRDPVSTDSTQDLTSISTTKKYVPKDSTQEQVSSGAAQNSAPVISTKESKSSGSAQKLILASFTKEPLLSDSEKTSLSVNLTPGRRSCDLFPEPFSGSPIVTSSTQMPTEQVFDEDSCSHLAQQDSLKQIQNLDLSLPNRDLNVSSQPNQNFNQETTSLSVAGPTSSPNKIFECASIASDFDPNEKIGAIKTTATVEPDTINKEPTHTRPRRKGNKRTNIAPDIKLREPRKRTCRANINYGEELQRNKTVNSTKKNVEKHKAKNKLAVNLKRKNEYGSSSTKEEDEDGAGNMPKRKVQRTGKGKEKDMPVKKDDEEEAATTEEEEMKVNQLLQSKDSFLTTVDLKELIPQWLEALPEEDRLELVPLLPGPDCEIKEGNLIIREGFGDGSTYLYEAATQWQTALALGGFEKDNHEFEGQVSTDSFKDETYEENWGERLRRDQKAKTKDRGRSKKNK